MGSTISGIIRIRNTTNSDVSSISVYDFDSFDFGTLRPDRIFNGQSVPASGCIEKSIQFTTLASHCPFTTRLTFADKTEDVFRLNYKCVFDGNELSFKHLTKTHKLHFKKTGPRVLEIILMNTEDQLENIRAEKLMGDGVKLMAMGRFKEASVRFMEAANRANEKGTITRLQEHIRKLRTVKEVVDVDKKAKSLNNEGLQCLSSVKFHEALTKFDEALSLARNSDTRTLIEDNMKIAKDAKLNQEAKKLNQEGLILRKNNQLEAAVAKFEEGLRTANDINLINSIKRNKADTLTLLGKEAFSAAWLADLSNPAESIHQFSKSKFFFQLAESVQSNPDHQHFISLISYKLEGEKLYNSGVLVQNEAARMVDRTMHSECSEDFKVAKGKYLEAWRSYKEAEKVFEEGWKKDRNFERAVMLTREALTGIEAIIDELQIVVF